MNEKPKLPKRLRPTEKSILLEGVSKGLYTRKQVFELYRAIEGIHKRIIDSKPHGIIYLLRGDLVFDRCLRLLNSLERQRYKEQKKKSLWYRLPSPIYVKIGSVTPELRERFTEGDLTKGLSNEEKHAVIQKVVDEKIIPIIKQYGQETTLFMIGEAMSGGSMKQSRKILDSHLHRLKTETGLPTPDIKTILIRKERKNGKRAPKPLSYTPTEHNVSLEHTQSMLEHGLEIFPVSRLFTIDKQPFHHPLIVGTEKPRIPKLGFDPIGAQGLMTLLTDFEKIHEFTKTRNEARLREH